MTISRGQMPRQLYGLGSLVKSITKPIKKAVSSVKDIVKSDIGKAAILGIGAFGLPGGFGGITGVLPANSFLRTLPSTILGGLSQGGRFEKLGGVLRDVAIGTGVAGATDYLTRPELDPSQQRTMGRTEEELDELEEELRKNYENLGYSKGEIDLLVEQGMKEYGRDMNAYGGRIGLESGTIPGGYTKDAYKYLREMDRDIKKNYKKYKAGGGTLDFDTYSAMSKETMFSIDFPSFRADGGRVGYARGDTAEENAMQASGIMGLPLNQNPAGVTELDLRESGGFIPPVGVKEKADDIPAMLSNNEFVFTADAVRGMGDGDVNRGAERMYSMMKQLENGGRV